jgi:hypothetical protein
MRFLHGADNIWITNKQYPLILFWWMAFGNVLYRKEQS